MAAGAAIRFDLDPLERGERQLEEVGVLEQVADQRPMAGAAEAGHPVLHVGEEALARLLAVVADVDAGVDLAAITAAVASATARRSSSGSTDFAAAAPAVQLGQRRRPRQAARVGGEDA